METFGLIPVLTIVMTYPVKEGWKCVLTGHGGQSVTHHLALGMLKLLANNLVMMATVRMHCIHSMHVSRFLFVFYCYN